MSLPLNNINSHFSNKEISDEKGDNLTLVHNEIETKNTDKKFLNKKSGKSLNKKKIFYILFLIST